MADVKEYAAELLRELKNAQPNLERNEGRIADVAREKETWDKELEDWSSSTNKLMHPRRFLWELTRALPEDALVTTDIGNTCSIANGYLRFEGPRQHLPALTWGNCGFAYGAAMGAKIGKPDAPVFAIQGDGAWGISGLSEVMTAVQEDVPVVAIVINNHEWGAEKKNQIDFYGRLGRSHKGLIPAEGVAPAENGAEAIAAVLGDDSEEEEEESEVVAAVRR